MCIRDRPSTILKLFITKLTDPNPDGAVLGVNILASLQVSLTGFFLAIIIGIPLGLLMGWYGGFESFIRPIFELIRPIPPVSWIPLTIVWLGIGLPAKAFIAVSYTHLDVYKRQGHRLYCLRIFKTIDPSAWRLCSRMRYWVRLRSSAFL